MTNQVCTFPRCQDKATWWAIVRGPETDWLDEYHAKCEKHIKTYQLKERITNGQ